MSDLRVSCHLPENSTEANVTTILEKKEALFAIWRYRGPYHSASINIGRVLISRELWLKSVTRFHKLNICQSFTPTVNLRTMNHFRNQQSSSKCEKIKKEY